MPEIEESVSISRPPQEVFDVVSNPENIPMFDSSVIHTELIGGGPVGVGTRFRGTSKVLGRSFDWTAEIVEHDPPRRSTSKSVEGKLDFTVSMTCEAEDGGTRLTQRIEAASGLGGIFGRIGDPLVEKVQARTVRANLESLAEYLAEHPHP
ncbi:SRPBCC family protein [Sinomonas mesophila]|uniref:SRPBCC family protein n=1 Tax=Sinomonas mesophila TaxID=1531955 RepID=UPI00158E8FBC|nr:SRPBCC family protein [Sinomonas mesophila]